MQQKSMVFRYNKRDPEDLVVLNQLRGKLDYMIENGYSISLMGVKRLPGDTYTAESALHCTERALTYEMSRFYIQKAKMLLQLLSE